MSAHRHKFRVSSWRKDTVEFACRCGEHRSREMDAEEKRRHNAEWTWKPKPENNIHRVYHEFVRRFMTKDGDGWKYEGYDLMQRVERWAEKHPSEVKITNCDDDHHSSSALVLIEHRCTNDYMGTTVVFIPQCTGESPIRFFLYPNSRDCLVDCLREIARESKPVEKRSRKIEKERSKWWASRPVPRRQS